MGVAAAFLAQQVKRRVACGAVKPPGQRSVLPQAAGQRARFAGEIDEDPLGNFARQVRRADLPPRRRINQVGVPMHNLAEGGVGVLNGVLPQQLSIGLCLHLTY